MMKNGDSLAATLIKWIVLLLNSINYYGKQKSKKTRFLQISITYSTKFSDDQHTCDPDVVKFSLSIMYAQGKSAFNFLHEPKFYGQGRMLEGNKNFSKFRLNLGRPSESLVEFHM